MEDTISLKDLLQTLKKRLALIMAITLTAVIVSGVLSFFFLTPIYQSSTQILVNQKNDDQMMYNRNELDATLQLINTYNVIIKSPAILDLVTKELDLNMTAQQLNKRITVGSENESQVVNISVQDEDPQRAANIANTIASVFKEEVVDIMNVDNVSILTTATVAKGQVPVKPKPLLNIALSLVIGLMAGGGLALLIEYFDNTVKSEQEIEKHLKLPILGVISVIDGSQIDSMKDKRNKKVKTRGETFGS